MIIQEHITIDGRDFIRTYSNDRRMVVRDGVGYSEAIDPVEFNRQYTEGDFLPEDEWPATAEEIASILLGESEE